jgi:hypothetical protein
MPPMRRFPARAFRLLGVAAIAGVFTGIVVAGLGGRVIMKLVALTAGAGAVGKVTENGNTVGDLTLPGTLQLVLFSGVMLGLIGGLLYLALRPWLAWFGRWRGFAFGVIVLALMGHAVFEPGNGDFRRFGAVGVNVALFSALFVLYGLLIAPLVDWIARAADHSRAAAAVAWIGVVPAVVSIALGVGATAAGLLGLNAELRAAFGLLIVGTLLAGALGRIIGERRPASLAVVAVPVIGGVAVTAPAIARIIGG